MSTRNIIQALQGAAGAAAAGPVLDVDDVFSTTTYFGDGSNGTAIVNGIDLSGEGGLVWRKKRSSGGTINDHVFVDTERGKTKFTLSNSAAGEVTSSNSITSFNNNGFTIVDNNSYGQNLSNETYVSWTWRKATNWFDIVQYTGNNGTQTINHNLGSVPGMIIVKRLDDAGNWSVFHRSLGATKFINLNQNNEAFSNSSYWNDTAPTSTQFTVGLTNSVSGASYVAYLFAHHNSDGTFGPDVNQDIIECGTYTGDGQIEGPTINLGFEPQWLLFKCSSHGEDWYVVDNIRDWTVDGKAAYVRPRLSNAEASFDGSSSGVRLNSTGFQMSNNSNDNNGNGKTYIYVAIRRGPLAQPTAVDDVFDVDTVQASSGNQPAFKFDFVTDFLFSRQVTATQDWLTNARLIGQNQLKLNSSGAQSTNTAFNWDYMDGAWDPFSASPAFSAWGWKRAPGFFDVTTWKGNGVNGRQITHNLGVAPEMIWVKLRNTYNGEWMVFHKDLTTNNNLILESSSGEGAYARVTSPTATTFTVSNDTSVNNTVSGGLHYIAFMWASVSGISKLGSYTGNGTSQTIDCGFSNGVRLVLVKQVGSGSWFLFDYGRSIVSGNDSLLQLNASGGEYTAADYIDPDSSGFIAVGDNNNMNTNGQKFIFYAIAA